ncbi:hypothetical protein FACS1894127_3160 [Clostridia bacterium]|nr:hypothetical protein FACS1894127_3160 [Clostridia bacterium]
MAQASRILRLQFGRYMGKTQSKNLTYTRKFVVDFEGKPLSETNPVASLMRLA